MKLDQSASIVGSRAAEPRLLVYDPADVVDPEPLVRVEVTELRQSPPRRCSIPRSDEHVDVDVRAPLARKVERLLERGTLQQQRIHPGRLQRSEQRSRGAAQALRFIRNARSESSHELVQEPGAPRMGV
jgi:hypothetical protein